MSNVTTIENLTDAEFDRMDNLHDAAPKFCGRYARITPEYLRERDRKIRARGRAKYLARHAAPAPAEAPKQTFSAYVATLKNKNVAVMLQCCYQFDGVDVDMPADPQSFDEVETALRQHPHMLERDIEAARRVWEQYEQGGAGQ